MESSDTLNKFYDIFATFDKSFSKAYSESKTRGKSKLLKFITSFYKKWYYSSLIPDTILSPANLLQLLSEENKISQLIAYSPFMANHSRLSKIEMKKSIYTLENHPIVDDLKILIENCEPFVLLDEENCITSEYEEKILYQVSIFDPFYVQYLCILALHLKLIKKIPSINCNKAQVNNNLCETFFSIPSKEILKKVVDTSLSITVSQIYYILPINKGIINETFFYNVLKNTETTDKLFIDIYASMGISFEDIAEMSEDEFYDEVTGAIMSSTFFIGIAIDKFFYTIFGFYLNLINPCYLMPYDFSDELEFAIDTFKENDEISVAMFSPCSHHKLTKLGLEFFDCEKTSENSITFQNDVSYDTMSKLLTHCFATDGTSLNQINSFININADAPFKKVYELKVKLDDNKLVWKNFELPENMNLHEIYLEICYEFFFDANLNYNFFPTLEENHFMEYSSPAIKRRSKKADNIMLKDLEFEEKSKFLLVLHDLNNHFSNTPNLPVKNLKLELEVLRIKDRSPTKFYPRVLNASKAFIKFESNLY